VKIFTVFIVYIKGDAMININKTQSGEKITLALSGKLDTVTAQTLHDALIPEFDDAKHIELDFADLNYVSSAGLRILLIGEKTAKAKGSKQTLINVSTGVMKILDMTGFITILNIE